MLQISLKIRIINKRNQFFLLIGTLTIGEKLTLKIKKGKLQDVPFVTQKCIGEKHAFLNMPSCPHVVDVAKSFSEFQDEKVWDEEVNIILITNEFEILISEMETNAITDTACMKTLSGEKWFLNFLKWNLNFFKWHCFE